METDPSTSPQQHKISNCILIVGPTAVGKTALAIQVANWLHTEIISADSRQCFRELNIGVARPSPEELGQVRHHFIASHSIFEELNAAVFESYALAIAGTIFSTRRDLVMVGGTGLYVKAFTEGMDDIPEPMPGVREQVVAGYQEKGLEWLQQEIRQKDPLYSATGEMQNPHRLMRALEVVLSTGRSIRSFQSGHKRERPFRIIKLGLELPRQELYERINQRVDQMMSAGLLNEVKEVYNLLQQKGALFLRPHALQTVGYAELLDFLEGSISLTQAVEKIKTNTRHYAKRQMTWFRRDPELTWFHPADIAGIKDWLAPRLSQQ